MSAGDRRFLWGAATAAHQVEGGNVNNDWWVREHAEPRQVHEPSGDACDSYHRYGEDLDLVAAFGLDAYRFSLEWSRIEPADGEFSRAALDHYRRMIDGCHQRGLVPMVTLHHFTVPRWFQERGGWRWAEAVGRFGRFCERAVAILGDVEWACTINEPNIIAVITRLQEGAPPPDVFPPPPDPSIGETLLAAHVAARDVLHSVPGLAVGWTVAGFNFHPVEGEVPSWLPLAQDWYLEQARDDDFLGIQTYSRIRVGPGGPVPPPEGAELTGTGWEFYPECVGEVLQRAWPLAGGVPLVVTENGIATDDDTRRIHYLERALAGVEQAVAAGVDVRGYFHWSLLDNFEWASGYGPRFGLVSVDRQTFARTVKPSARWLGEVAAAATWPGRDGRRDRGRS